MRVLDFQATLGELPRRALLIAASRQTLTLPGEEGVRPGSDQGQTMGWNCNCVHAVDFRVSSWARM
jgi:hypothetical protein